MGPSFLWAIWGSLLQWCASLRWLTGQRIHNRAKRSNLGPSQPQQTDAEASSGETKTGSPHPLTPPSAASWRNISDIIKKGNTHCASLTAQSFLWFILTGLSIPEAQATASVHPGYESLGGRRKIQGKPQDQGACNKVTR